MRWMCCNEDHITLQCIGSLDVRDFYLKREQQTHLQLLVKIVDAWKKRAVQVCHTFSHASWYLYTPSSSDWHAHTDTVCWCAHASCWDHQIIFAPSQNCFSFLCATDVFSCLCASELRMMAGVRLHSQSLGGEMRDWTLAKSTASLHQAEKNHVNILISFRIWSEIGQLSSTILDTAIFVFRENRIWVLTVPVNTQIHFYLISLWVR